MDGFSTDESEPWADMMGAADPMTLILENSRASTPRLVPEVSLYLAADDLPLYRMGEDELEAAGFGTPYWAFAWAGGQALSRYILDNPSAVRGRRVVDFGAGSGLVAIAAAKAGAFDVIATDIDPIAQEAMRLNADLNDVHIDIDGQDITDRHSKDWEVVLVGDVFYEADLARRLLPWLRGLHGTGTEVLIGDPGRFYLPRLGLERVASYHAPTTGLMEDTDLRNAGVWRFTNEDASG